MQKQYADKAHKMPLLTLKQVEDYLIYRCPLEQVTREIASRLGITNRLYPFRVRFDAEFSVIDKTPWACYQRLARIIYRDSEARITITGLYYSELNKPLLEL